MLITFFCCCRNSHRRDATERIVGDGRLARTVDRVAGGTTKGVVVARQVEVVLPLVRAAADDVVGVEVGDDAYRGCFGQIADAVVGHRDHRRAVGVDGGRQVARRVIGVVRRDAARPCARHKPCVLCVLCG